MEFNKVNKEIADRKKASKGKDGCEDLMEKSKEIKSKIEEQEKEADNLDAQRNAKLNLIGNIVSDKVPIFKDEDNNEVRTKWGTIPALEVDGKTIGKLHHHEVMGLLDLVEFERG
jgi:seryl-tRNA synthetase